MKMNCFTPKLLKIHLHFGSGTKRFGCETKKSLRCLERWENESNENRDKKLLCGQMVITNVTAPR